MRHARVQQLNDANGAAPGVLNTRTISVRHSSPLSASPPGSPLPEINKTGESLSYPSGTFAAAAMMRLSSLSCVNTPVRRISTHLRLRCRTSAARSAFAERFSADGSGGAAAAARVLRQPSNSLLAELALTAGPQVAPVPLLA